MRKKNKMAGESWEIPTDFIFLFIMRVVFFFFYDPSWSESSFILFLFFYSIRVGPSRSELIRPGLAVRVNPVRLLYLPLEISSQQRALLLVMFPAKISEQATLQNLQCMTFADCRPQTADCRLQTADCRPQIADCKLKDTKNLPNKGDTIKNITSCESEKVAWEQGWYFCAKLHWPHSQDAVGYSSSTLSQLTQHITSCVDSLFFFDYCELIMTSSNAH